MVQRSFLLSSSNKTKDYYDQLRLFIPIETVILARRTESMMLTLAPYQNCG